MICKVRLEFRKLAKHTSHRRLQPAPFTVKQARKHHSYPCRACWPLAATFPMARKHPNYPCRTCWPALSKPTSALWCRLICSNLQETLDLRADPNCKRKLHWPTLPLRPRLSTRSPAKQPTSLHLLITIITSSARKGATLHAQG